MDRTRLFLDFYDSTRIIVSVFYRVYAYLGKFRVDSVATTYFDSLNFRNFSFHNIPIKDKFKIRTSPEGVRLAVIGRRTHDDVAKAR